MWYVFLISSCYLLLALAISFHNHTGQFHSEPSCSLYFSKAVEAKTWKLGSLLSVNHLWPDSLLVTVHAPPHTTPASTQAQLLVLQSLVVWLVSDFAFPGSSPNLVISFNQRKTILRHFLSEICVMWIYSYPVHFPLELFFQIISKEKKHFLVQHKTCLP